MTHGSGVPGARLLQCACTFEAGRRHLSLSAIGETLVATDAGGSWGRGRDMGGCETRGEGIGSRGLVYDLLVGDLLRGQVVLGGQQGSVGDKRSYIKLTSSSLLKPRISRSQSSSSPS